MLSGNHLIAGEWVGDTETFTNMPIDGTPDSFAVGRPEHVDRAVRAAETAFASYAGLSRAARAAFLRAIAEEIEMRAAAITEIGTRETGLPAARLEGERGRTTGQLRLFADHIEAGDYLDRRHDPALPDRAPLPRPDLRVMQQPIGPVAVFGASNFPLAFSVAGGDTASALAAGCPVVVKGHSAHPGTGEIVAQAILAAINSQGIDPGVFSLVQGGTRETGQALVTHPLIRAVGFTGSLDGGRALFDLCAARPEPIPFFGELGSVNPMFLLPAALAARGGEIASGWAGSLTMGAGQFCTNPGIAVVIDGPDADAFAEASAVALSQGGEQVMLTDGIATAYRAGRDRVAGSAGVQELLTSVCDFRNATPYLYRTTGAAWMTNEVLGEEVFGPFGLIVSVADADEMQAVAASLKGQLTCTLHMDQADTDIGRDLLPTLQRKAGRVLANGFPTGVEVCDAMVHGGPYPASTNFGHTSVGTLAIRRWLRPVCHQNLPNELLPADLK
ncbi:aldehyde dehydrogenase (NADP(+)) [Antarcticimicrobium luteum]|uniref:Aldehyde dehydrogenase (NADP(+)) n=1 Tax=Antarcticimicrobium luteum TaxID=2547397 RepID=A0A4V6PM52_9RHOB|nr:aldehyde dehydrogenase (NADP(+)) [Antarcticimicrobium luteum]TDK45647.1 aldehyde dehydrogenase (NADP(+)) [Antarcticimicrobium luteum]